MTSSPRNEPQEFFRVMHERFGQILAAGRGRAGLIHALTSQAFDLFERNVTLQTAGVVLACHKGCPACCCIRVTATAPEVYLLAGYIRRIHETPGGARLDLPRRVAESDQTVRDLNADSCMSVHCFCPLMLKDSCVIHPVRPLACRGHAAFDKNACMDAAAGRAVDVPLSESHAVIRSLVQDALQSALRAQGYAWRAYELNHALHLALSHPEAEAEGLDGSDILAPALVADTDWEALGDMFDQVVGHARVS